MSFTGGLAVKYIKYEPQVCLVYNKIEYGRKSVNEEFFILLKGSLDTFKTLEFCLKLFPNCILEWRVSQIFANNKTTRRKYK